MKKPILNFEEQVIGALTQLQSDVSGLKVDFTDLKTDVSGLKADVTNLKSDVSDIKKDIGELKTDVRRLEILHEVTDGKIDQIIEDLSPTMSGVTGLRDHQQDQDDKILFHDRRIGILEKKLA